MENETIITIEVTNAEGDHTAEVKVEIDKITKIEKSTYGRSQLHMSGAFFHFDDPGRKLEALIHRRIADRIELEAEKADAAAEARLS